jgi:4-amino-4-deoxy-L-arabinose transferase-like glycosyltransferase
VNTESRGQARKRFRLALGTVLALAAALRLWHIGFGLPALNDPDEPVFVMTALDMLREHRLDPQWFGHPATLLLYALALIVVVVALAGSWLGRWHGVAGFVAAVFADPGVAIVPMRLFIALCGLATIALTCRLGRRGANARTGLGAALLLAVNALHIAQSQVIRTDMLATALTLWASLHALAIARGGGRRHHVLAGIAIGLATATKWPAVLALANVAAANGRGRRIWLAPVVAMVTLFAISPYLLIDHARVLHDLGGEARPHHLGASGHGFFPNLAWYLAHPLAGSFGAAGLALAAIGLVPGWRDNRALVLAIVPGTLLQIVVMAGQALIWERWAVPLLPPVALFAALALDRIATRLPLWLAALALVLAPMAITARTRAVMRADDTRQAASAWVRARIAPGASILVEDAAFDLLRRPGPLLFPLGSAGCIDVRAALARPPSYTRVDSARSGRAIVDLGDVPAPLLGTCRADVAILSHWRRYDAEAALYPAELANYRRFVSRGRIVGSFAPIPGRRGGPVVDIIAFDRTAPSGQRVRALSVTPMMRTSL